MYKRIYRIPSDEYQSYIIISEKNPLLCHNGKITNLDISNFSILLGGSQLILTNGMNFIIPPDNIINYSFPPSLNATVLTKETNQENITYILEQLEEHSNIKVQFKGARAGYIFTTREGITDYYIDNPPKTGYVNKLADTEEFIRRQYNID